MTLDDLPLERSNPKPSRTPPQPAPSHSSPVRWIVLGAAAVLIGGALTLWWLSRAQPGTATPASTAPTDVVVSNRPKRQMLDLPPLDDSDTLLRQLVSALSQHPQLAKLLATQGLIRAATLATVQIGDGKTPASPLLVLRPTTRVGLAGNAPTGKLDPATYARWDSDTAALVSIDPKDLAQLYVNVELLFDQSYQELGHPSAKFDEAIVHAIDTLGETPTVDQDIVLIRKPGFLDHENPTLRTLLPVQKQFLLLGPDNRRKIMAWLRKLAKDLDLPIG
jgi:hypothetical protein